MTEDEWLGCEDPSQALDHLCNIRLNRTKAQRRKFWLFGCGCCRRIWKLFKSEPLCASMVVAAERFADGAAPFTDVVDCDRKLTIPNYGLAQQVRSAARALAYTNVQIVAHGAAEFCAGAVCHGLVYPHYPPKKARELAQSARLLRCIFGNPFRPVAFDPAWRTSTAVAVAAQMYESHDFSAMPILADALQDAGCDSGGVLNHCRTDTVHARGCWVVDSVLGKA